MIRQILLMGEGGFYNIAEKTADELGLKLNKNKKISAKEVVPYGLSFKFGHNASEENFGTYGYLDYSYKEKYKEILGNFPKPKDYGKLNLDITIKGLEDRVKDQGADYIFIDNFNSKDMGTFWGISGRAQLLLKLP
jgi:hypothetical protein